jgi:hypothetical protein
MSTTPFKSQNMVKALQSSAGQVTTTNRACFNCHETGHFIANCPYNKDKLAASAYSNSVNGPRPALSGTNRVPLRTNNHTGNPNSQQMRQPQQLFG